MGLGFLLVVSVKSWIIAEQLQGHGQISFVESVVKKQCDVNDTRLYQMAYVIISVTHRRQFKTKVVESKSELAVRKLLLHNGLCD